MLLHKKLLLLGIGVIIADAVVSVYVYNSGLVPVHMERIFQLTWLAFILLGGALMQISIGIKKKEPRSKILKKILILCLVVIFCHYVTSYRQAEERQRLFSAIESEGINPAMK